MAFLLPTTTLPTRRRSLPKNRCPPRAIDQTALVAVATVVIGVGGGIGLVAWTEEQGKRTTQRENVQPCAECRGETVTPCNICGASGKDPLNDTKLCSYCEGKGSIKCFNCAGSGIQPRFLDRLSPDDFMD